MNPEAITRYRDPLQGDEHGNVTIEQFTQWLNLWMVNGSDDKEMICGPYAYVAVAEKCNFGGDGYSLYGYGDHGRFTTPFGKVLVTINRDMTATTIYAVDNKATGRAGLFGSSIAMNIRKIVPNAKPTGPVCPHCGGAL